MKQKEINIGAGIVWNAQHVSDTHSYFPDYDPGNGVPRRINRALHNADPDALLAELDPHSITNGAGTANVHEVRSNPNLLVKLSREPFSHFAANAILERVWATNPRYHTPRYLGHLTTPDLSATVMTRVNGQQIAEARPTLSHEDLTAMQQRIKTAGQIGLQGYGLDPSILAWDLNTHNIFHHSQTGRVQPDDPLTIIDQTPSVHLGADAWHEHQEQVVDIRDPRDIAAAAAIGEQDAFDKFFTKA